MNSGTYPFSLKFVLEDDPDRLCTSPELLFLFILSGKPAVTSVVNIATGEADFSPGTVISIAGTELSTSAPVAAQFNSAGIYPTTLGSSAVYLNETPLPLLYVSPERIDAVIPHSVGSDLAEGDLVVRAIQRSPSDPKRIRLYRTSPGIFRASASGGGLGIYNQDGTANGVENPARRGTEIQMRVTGVGVWNRALPDGSVALSSIYFPGNLAFVAPEVILRPQAPIRLTIGGQAAEIRRLDVVPYELFGTLNVVAVVPPGVGSGMQPAVLTAGERSNEGQQVMVAVQD